MQQFGLLAHGFPEKLRASFPCRTSPPDKLPHQPPRCNGQGGGVYSFLRSGVEQRSFARTVSPFGAPLFTTLVTWRTRHELCRQRTLGRVLSGCATGGRTLELLSFFVAIWVSKGMCPNLSSSRVLPCFHALGGFSSSPLAVRRFPGRDSSGNIPEIFFQVFKAPWWLQERRFSFLLRSWRLQEWQFVFHARRNFLNCNLFFLCGSLRIHFCLVPPDVQLCVLMFFEAQSSWESFHAIFRHPRNTHFSHVSALHPQPHHTPIIHQWASELVVSCVKQQPDSRACTVLETVLALSQWRV